MIFREGDRVIVKDSIVHSLVGETGVIVELWGNRNADVRFDNPNIPSLFLKSSNGKHQSVRGMSLDILELIEDDEVYISEDDMSFILGVIV